MTDGIRPVRHTADHSSLGMGILVGVLVVVVIATGILIVKGSVGQQSDAMVQLPKSGQVR